MLSTVIVLLLALMTTASILYCLVCICAAWKFFADADKGRPSRFCPPVTVLIPLCGADFQALENFVSFSRQHYPQYQIVFGVQDPDDTSVRVVRQLMTLFPERDIELVISSELIGQNPKVSNLHNMLSKAKHEVIVIVDSDIRVGSDFLQAVVAELHDEKVGLVTCPYRAGAAPNLPSTLEAIGITTEFIPGVFVARLLEGVTFALGATMATTKEKIRTVGGMRAIADFLADDYMLGNLIHKAGFEVRLAPYVVRTMPVHSTFLGMIRHQVRWARGTRICRPMSYVGYVITHGIALGLLGMMTARASLLSVALFWVAVTARTTMAWFVGVHLLKDEILRRHLWLLPVRDLLSFGVWCVSFFGSKVEWRGRFYRIVEGGKLIPIEQGPSQKASRP